MSIKAVGDAFRKGIGEKATCSGATMHYERGDQGTESQVLSFDVQPDGGERQTFTYKIDGRADPVACARDAAEHYLQSIEQH